MSATSAVRPLPSGRHNLPREFVVRDQRDRMLDAIANACVEKGFPWVSVADIVGRARVSRATFYEHFADKEDCFLQAFDTIAAKFLADVTAACQRPELTWPEQIEAGLRTILRFLAAEPAFARMCLVDAMVAGPAALERYRAAVRVIAGFVELGREHAPDRTVPACVPGALVGGATLVIRDEILAGRTAELPARLPDLLYATLAPFVTREEALARSQAAADDATTARALAHGAPAA